MVRSQKNITSSSSGETSGSSGFLNHGPKGPSDSLLNEGFVETSGSSSFLNHGPKGPHGGSDNSSGSTGASDSLLNEGSVELSSLSKLKPVPPRKPRKTLKPRKLAPGSKALREIRQLQKGTGNLIPRKPLARLAREVANNLDGEKKEFLWQKEALMCIHEAAEAYLVHLFKDSNLCAIHAKRVTVMPTDMNLARKIRGEVQKN